MPPSLGALNLDGPIKRAVDTQQQQGNPPPPDQLLLTAGPLITCIIGTSEYFILSK
jgi:hypothetical protein